MWLLVDGVVPYDLTVDCNVLRSVVVVVLLDGTMMTSGVKLMPIS